MKRFHVDLLNENNKTSWFVCLSKTIVVKD